MLKKTLCMLAACTLALQACSQKAEKTANGLEYKIVEDAGNKQRAKVGDYITLHFTYRNYKDSVLGTSHQSKEPITVKVQATQFKGGFEEGLTLVGAGDSALFYVPTDSLFKGAPAGQRPAFLPVGSKLTFGVKVTKIMTEADMYKDQAAKLEGYAKAKNLTVQKTASGLMYAITKQGTGDKPQMGDTVVAHYTGTLLDGKKFDSSLDRSEPFKFNLGQRMVIPGWDEGFALLNPGTKAVLLIPSNLAYGEQGSPPVIPPLSPLVFEVELLSYNKPGKAAVTPAAKVGAKTGTSAKTKTKSKK